VRSLLQELQQALGEVGGQGRCLPAALYIARGDGRELRRAPSIYCAVHSPEYRYTFAKNPLPAATIPSVPPLYTHLAGAMVVLGVS
jgi:hypothetical protein